MNVNTPKRMTAEYLDGLPKDERLYEIVQGELREVLPVCAYGTKLEAKFAYHFLKFVEDDHANGELLTGTMRYGQRRDPDGKEA
ncbi:MAG: hypothetical protein O3B01_02815 [Planctomycetota bacterium]|nr:hypothetical protein [Planctomycetota bacterium]MDA1137491.1 hypothetical protein [Planctomycetota bacterium]